MLDAIVAKRNLSWSLRVKKDELIMDLGVGICQQGR